MGQDGKTILAFVPDLFFSTKIQDTAKHLGHTATISRTPDDFVRKAQELSPALLIVDLTAEGTSLEELLMQLRREILEADGTAPSPLRSGRDQRGPRPRPCRSPGEIPGRRDRVIGDTHHGTPKSPR